jgi:hypothetical protein
VVDISNYVAGNPIFQFFIEFWWIFPIVIIGLIIFWLYDRSKKAPKIIVRSEIERKKRIQELSMNANMIPDIVEINTPMGIKKDVVFNFYDKLYIGGINRGKIFNIMPKTDKDGRTFEIVYQPFLFWFIVNPFAKKNIINVRENVVNKYAHTKELSIRGEVAIDNVEGSFYDIPNEILHLNKINENLWKHDKENTTSFYETESQKESIIDIDHRKKMSEKQLELQIAKENRAQKIS